MPTSRKSHPRIDSHLVTRLISAQFPQWSGHTVRAVAKPGYDNMTFRLGEEMSVRLPRCPRWTGQVEREQRWLPRLAPYLPLPVPHPLGRGEPDADFPFPWSVYRWIDGEDMRFERLDAPDRAAADLAAFITALQGADATGGPPPEWSNGFRGVAMGDSADSVTVEARVLPKIAALEGRYDLALLNGVWEAAMSAPAWGKAPVWVHGDLAAGNLLMKDGRLSAVIDFGTLAVGDPACDLIPAWLFLATRHTRQVFRSALGVDDATWVRGRGWGLAQALPEPGTELTEATRRTLDALAADRASDDR
ncbi:aminoglycoside phosphotransferase family protein [Nocardiopsis ansamitocini]|uniref:Aminoglycoside phosphotransferase n=1 Tax=Nocardiopsis ansamitocini TaxID=1670832 RepID=A0A9W6UKE5_9ACTN|nr:aminoglycoside phosphotransferase family protein [Nocardiopsis ansamitocini]GLU49503.1 aminoglycoside phosphotransferase [Nocardiopsis ansamitocini]